MKVSKETKEVLREVRNEKKYGDPVLREMASADACSAFDYEMYKLSKRDARREEISSGVAFLICIISLATELAGFSNNIFMLSWPFIVVGAVFAINARIERLWAQLYWNNIFERNHTLTIIGKKKCQKK